MTFSDMRERAAREWAAFTSPQRPRILIGAVTCGRAAGAIEVRAAFESELRARGLAADLHEVGCLGLCYAEPLVEIVLPAGLRILYRDVTPDAVPRLVEETVRHGRPAADLALALTGETSAGGVPHLRELPMIRSQSRIVLRNAGVIDPASVWHYLARGGYAGLQKALSMQPEEVVELLKQSGLRGRGGAGFPTGAKWEFARKAHGSEKYVICNADEGDPGAFMDRSVLESDPHSALEGLAIAAYAVGARHGHMYVRAEYPLAVERVSHAIGQMRELGLLGERILGADFAFDVTISKGAGAFVCGEETALIASIEGRRGMPRPRPPFPAQSGLFGRPTVINNVETLANVPEILSRGAAWFRGFGTERSPGTKTFALAGKIARTGLIEVPMGMKLRDIIFEVGGGIPDGKAFKAVQTGGPSGGCLPAELLDLPVDYEELARAGSIMGSGGMIVLDSDSCMVEIARYFLEFTHHESCGKCTPCRMGSQHLLRLLTEITEGKAGPSHVARLEKLAQTVKAGSLCGLGQTLPNPVLSTLKYFAGEYSSHIEARKCPAGVCKALFAYRVAPEKCVACGACKRNCAYGAIEGEKKVKHRILPEKCTRCGVCFEVCPVDAIVKE